MKMKNIILIIILLASFCDADAGRLAREIHRCTSDIIAEGLKKYNIYEGLNDSYRYCFPAAQPIDNMRINNNDEVYLQVRLSKYDESFYVIAWTKSGRYSIYPVFSVDDISETRFPKEWIESLVWGKGNTCKFMPVPKEFADMVIHGDKIDISKIEGYYLFNIKFSIRKGRIINRQVYISQFPVPCEEWLNPPRNPKRGQGPVRLEYYEF